jgi:hypothetical protein
MGPGGEMGRGSEIGFESEIDSGELGAADAQSMITLTERSSSEGRAVRTKRVNHAIKQEDRPFSACTIKAQSGML